jgi:hypothetical protein
MRIRLNDDGVDGDDNDDDGSCRLEEDDEGDFDFDLFLSSCLGGVLFIRM